MKNESSAVGKSKERNDQYFAYKSGTEEGKTIDSISAVERYVKNVIYPRIKFLSDVDDDYDEPDFAGDATGKQSVALCNRILLCLGRTKCSIKEKVMWWVAYRKIIKRKISKLRHADVRSIRILFIEGEGAMQSRFIFFSLFLPLPLLSLTTVFSFFQYTFFDNSLRLPLQQQ